MKRREIIEKMYELEARLRSLEKRKKQKRLAWLAALFAIPVGLWAATVIPHGFADGDTLSAAKLNENFQVLAAKIDAMEGKRWRLIYETDVTTATTSVNVTGLDGDVDKEYMFLVRIVGAGTGCTLLVRPNNDSATNYGDQRVSGVGTGTAGASRDTAATGLVLATAQNPGDVGTGTGFLLAKSGYARIMNSINSDTVSGTTVTGASQHASVWNNTGTNITSLAFASAASCIGAGSHIEIWARR